MSASRAGALALGIGLLLVACLTRSPAVEFYTLGATEASSRSGSGGAGEGLALAVGPLSLPRYLDRPQLARRTNENQIRYDERRRWAGALEGELLRVVGANLAALLPSERVVVYPAVPPFPLAYRILIDVERFEADGQDEVSLEARWSIIPARGGDALRVGRVVVAEQARSASATDLVAAHSTAAGALSRALAEALGSLPDTPDPEQGTTAPESSGHRLDGRAPRHGTGAAALALRAGYSQ